MCGRYGLAVRLQLIAERFGVVQGNFDWQARYNIAPSQPAPVITQDGKLELATWGYQPGWMREKGGKQLINARAEGLATSRAFRNAFLEDRLVIPATMWYEWSRDRTPNLFKLKEGELFGLAGLRFEQDGESRFVIVTTEPNTLAKRTHNRMPGLLKREDEERWLSPDETDVQQLEQMLLPIPSEIMECYPVSKRVNSPSNDSAELVEPVR